MRSSSRLTGVCASGLLAFICLGARISAQTPPSGCVTCHASLPQEELSAPPKAVAGDVHSKASIRCSDCHGGDPASTEKAVAHDPARRYRGKPSGATICSTCHALHGEKFAASVHGPIFDRACVECHGNHGVKPPTNAMLGTSADAVCSTCHSEKDDPGFAAAERMWKDLDDFQGAITETAELVSRLENAGMEMGDQELALGEARSKLILAKTETHAFNPASLEAVIADGTTIVTGISHASQRAQADLAFRRRGLFVSLAAILLFVLALALRIRGLNDRHPH